MVHGSLGCQAPALCSAVCSSGFCFPFCGHSEPLKEKVESQRAQMNRTEKADVDVVLWRKVVVNWDAELAPRPRWINETPEFWYCIYSHWSLLFPLTVSAVSSTQAYRQNPHSYTQQAHSTTEGIFWQETQYTSGNLYSPRYVHERTFVRHIFWSTERKNRTVLCLQFYDS